MAKKINWWEVDQMWDEGQDRAPTLQRDQPRRDQPRRVKRKTKYRAPDIPIVEEPSVKIGPFAGNSETPTRNYPVAIYHPVVPTMHPLTQEMQERQKQVEDRAMREAMRDADRIVADRAAVAREAEIQRLANIGQGQQVVVMPATIFDHLRERWVWILLLLLVLTVAILAWIIGRQQVGPKATNKL